MTHARSRHAGPPAFDPRVPFSREDARRAGISLRQLTGPGYERILHDRYVSSAVEINDVLRAEVALRFCDPAGHVSHFTAARLWGAWVPDDSVASADAWRGHGAVLARRAARLVRPGVDSRMETRLRVLIVLAGLPEPVVNHVISHEDGRWNLRLDLAYPQWRLAIEYDGRQHAESDRQWQRDIDRRELLDRIDFRLIVVRAPGLFVDPLGTLIRIVDALADRGVRMRIKGDEWRRHFPGRSAVA